MKTLRNLIVLLALCAFAFSCGGDGKDAEEVTDNAVYLKVVVHYGDDTTDEPNDLARLQLDENRPIRLRLNCYGSNAPEIVGKLDYEATELMLFPLKDDFDDDATAETKTAIYLIPYANDGYECDGFFLCADGDGDSFEYFVNSNGDNTHTAIATLTGTGTGSENRPTVKCGETLILDVTRACEDPDYVN